MSVSFFISFEGDFFLRNSGDLKFPENMYKCVFVVIDRAWHWLDLKNL